MMKTEYKLIGLSKPKSATLRELDSESADTFNAPVKMVKDRFDALFVYCKNNWSEEKIATVEHDGFHDDGLPKNPRVIKIQTLK